MEIGEFPGRGISVGGPLVIDIRRAFGRDRRPIRRLGTQSRTWQSPPSDWIREGTGGVTDGVLILPNTDTLLVQIVVVNEGNRD